MFRGESCIASAYAHAGGGALIQDIVLFGERLLRLPSSECVRQRAFEKFRALGDGLMHPFEMLGIDVFQRVWKAMKAKWIEDHGRSSADAGGSAIGLSATDAYGQSLGR
jgi:hypothetical protein